MKKTICLHYCQAKNFGDALNPILIVRLTGCECVYAGRYSADIIGIGSILNRFTRPYFCGQIRNLLSRPAVVWSSGFIKEEDNPLKFRKNISFAAVRGKLSKQCVEKSVGRSVDVALGDGGLLFGCLLDKKPEKKYAIGFTPHCADFDNPIFKQLCDTVPNSKLINFSDDPLQVLEQIAQCEFILSTAMHGLIAADSLGIPNKWLKLSVLKGNEFKYNDYYSVFNIVPQHLNLEDVKDNKLTSKMIEDLAAEYNVDKNIVENTKSDLLKALINICKY